MSSSVVISSNDSMNEKKESIGISLVNKIKLPLSLYAAVWGCGFLSMVAMPFLIGALVGSGYLTGQLAGIVGTVELGVMASVTFLYSSRISRWPVRTVALYGALVAILGHTASMFCDSFYQLLIARTVAGVGAGFTLLAGQTLIAYHPDSSKLCAKMMVLTGLFVMLLLNVLGFTIERWGVVGAYGTQALWVLLMSPLMLMLPSERLPSVNEGTKGSLGGKSGLVVLCVLLFTVVDTSAWSFAERVGSSLGMGSDEIGSILGFTSLAGLVGAFIAAYLGIRLGRAMPIFVGVTLYAICGYLIYNTSALAVYMTAQILIGLAYMFTIPYIYGIAGDIDITGRTMAMASGAALIGAAIGPYLSAAIFSIYGYSPIGVFVAAGMLVVFIVASACCNGMKPALIIE